MARPPSPWTFINNTRTNVLDADDDWSTAVFAIALFGSTSGVGPTSTIYSSLVNEVPSGNGYTTGGNPAAFTLSGTSPVTVTLTDDVVWTGSGFGFPAYFAVLYAVLSGNIICYCLLDSTPQNVVVAAGATLTISNLVVPLATLS